MKLCELLKELDKISLNESPNLRKFITGLPVLIYVSKKQGSHGARIKFMNKYSEKWIDNDSISLSIEDKPRVVAPAKYKLKIKNDELKDIKAWIVLNKDALLDFWNCKIEYKDLLEKFD